MNFPRRALPPWTHGWFAYPADWYLRPTDAAGKMLRGEIPATNVLPISP